MRKTTLIKLSVAVIIIAFITAMVIIGNNMIEVNNYKIESENKRVFKYFKYAKLKGNHLNVNIKSHKEIENSNNYVTPEEH